jgi:hypothetical protein
METTKKWGAGEWLPAAIMGAGLVLSIMLLERWLSRGVAWATGAEVVGLLYYLAERRGRLNHAHFAQYAGVISLLSLLLWVLLR